MQNIKQTFPNNTADLLIQLEQTEITVYDSLPTPAKTNCRLVVSVHNLYTG